MTKKKTKLRILSLLYPWLLFIAFWIWIFQIIPFMSFYHKISDKNIDFLKNNKINIRTEKKIKNEKKSKYLRLKK